MTIIKKFQPYDFDICVTDEECGLREAECWQKANLTDPVGIQFDDPTSLLGADIIVDGDFTAGTIGATWLNSGAGNNWSDATDEACVSANSKFLTQAHVIAECECFKLVFDLKSDLGDDCILTFGGIDGAAAFQEIQTWSGIDATDDLELCWCAGVAYTSVGFQLNGSCDGDKCIDNVRLFPFEPVVQIESCNGSVIDTIADCDINLYCDHWDIVIDQWSDYITEDGCYRICIDRAEFIANGNMNNKILEWDQTGTGEVWTHNFALKLAQTVLAVDENSMLLSQELYLPQECTYTLTFDLSAIGGANSFTLDLYINGVVVNTWTTLGSKTYIIDENNDIESIGFIYTATVGGDTYRITNISIQKTICSKCFCVGAHDCTLLLSGTQSEDARDFMFDDSFTFWMRINAELLNENPIYTENIGRKSTGQFDLRYGDIVTSNDLTVYLQPNYIWKALYRIMINNEFRIEGTEYIKKEGDPEVTFEDNFGEGVIEVIKKSQLYRN